MPRYDVEVLETRKRRVVFEVEACCEEEARAKARLGASQDERVIVEYCEDRKVVGEPVDLSERWGLAEETKYAEV